MMRRPELDPLEIFSYSELKDLSFDLMRIVTKELQTAKIPVDGAESIVGSELQELKTESMAVVFFPYDNIWIKYINNEIEFEITKAIFPKLPREDRPIARTDAIAERQLLVDRNRLLFLPEVHIRDGIETKLMPKLREVDLSLQDVGRLHYIGEVDIDEYPNPGEFSYTYSRKSYVGYGIVITFTLEAEVDDD